MAQLVLHDAELFPEEFYPGFEYVDALLKIDGSKVPAEYVPKKGLLFFDAPKPLEVGTHSMEVGTSDLVGNSSVIAVTFNVKTN